ncbi:hypothetical protein ACFE35_08775 [Phormidesmis priestleyi ANT.L61.2]
MTTSAIAFFRQSLKLIVLGERWSDPLWLTRSDRPLEPDQNQHPFLPSPDIWSL